MAHTPTPWRMSKIGNPYDQYEVYAEHGGARVCTTVEGKANADFLVQAVNCHAALVNEVWEVLDWALMETAPLRTQEIASIRAVLREAEEETP